MNVIFESEDLPTVAQSGLLDHGIDIRVTVCEKSSERFWFDCRYEARADASGLESDMAFGQSARLMNSLCGHTRELRPVGPVGVPHDL